MPTISPVVNSVFQEDSKKKKKKRQLALVPKKLLTSTQ